MCSLVLRTMLIDGHCLGTRTCDQQVAGSNPGRHPADVQPWASCLHVCASVTKQYNLVPAMGGDARWLRR